MTASIVDVESHIVPADQACSSDFENGKVGAPVKGATLIGNGPDVLTRVSMIGNDLLDGGRGDDNLHGGGGNDRLLGGSGDVTRR